MNATTLPRRVAFYLRVSTDAQTVENQRLELERVAKSAGWEIVEIYQAIPSPIGVGDFRIRSQEGWPEKVE